MHRQGRSLDGVYGPGPSANATTNVGAGPSSHDSISRSADATPTTARLRRVASGTAVDEPIDVDAESDVEAAESPLKKTRRSRQEDQTLKDEDAKEDIRR